MHDGYHAWCIMTRGYRTKHCHVYGAGSTNSDEYVSVLFVTMFFISVDQRTEILCLIPLLWLVCVYIICVLCMYIIYNICVMRNL